MSYIIAPSAKSIAKQKKMREISALLQQHGILRSTDVVKLSEGLTITAANRYLTELVYCGNIRKIRMPGGRKNLRAYQFLCGYGTKTDIVSVALSNPLHQLGLSLFKKEL